MIAPALVTVASILGVRIILHILSVWCRETR